ncbi:MAG: type II secretion system protein [bacterium]|nr:type II secretion system protein [bacterium]
MNKKTGFTLIEAVISIGIIVLVMAAILASYPKFTDSMSLHKAVQLLASNVRRAQIYGVSVRGLRDSLPIFPGYGISFDLNSSINSYNLFADLNNDLYYGDISELVAKYMIEGNSFIYQLRAEDEKSSNCVSNLAGQIKRIDIIFKRPVPDIFLYVYDVNNIRSSACNDVEIVLRAPRGGEKTLVIWRSGQISVK